MDIIIKQVTTRRDLKAFIDFPYRHFKGNRYWCPPMRMDEYKTLEKDKNPAFEFCEAEYWLAYREGKLCGRIAGIINRKSNERWKENLVRFGWIDFVDDPEVSRKLIEAVIAWGKSKGMTGIHGPLGFSDMDNEGMLVKGFDELATMASIYNYSYYPEHLEKMGFQVAAEWVQYIMDNVPIPEKVERAARLASEKYHLRPLKVKKAKELLPYAAKMWNLLNLSFRDLYGFTGLTQKQMDAYTKQYFPFINPDYVSFVVNEKDDVVGFGISMPSLTRALQKCNGRMFPFGFIHILRALKQHELVDMYLNAVHPDYQGKGVVGIYHYEIQKGYLKNHVKQLVSNPQLADNKASQMWNMYNARQHLTRRCFVKHFE
ncbi:MAG TPA: hypothetical protein VMC08_00535 [Bacteroidales bacterium]|nr:hypothetical protein [Bacteroidales bacterium]